MALTNKQRKRFRTIAHSLKPVVTVSANGLSAPVIKEINRALDDHEMIKIKLLAADRESRKQLIERICRDTKSENIQEIGKVLVILRESREPQARLSNLLR